MYSNSCRRLYIRPTSELSEIGNSLYLAEQDDGLIVDGELMQSKKTDAKLVKPSVTRIIFNYGAIDRYSADRGFDSPDASQSLERENIINSICPRSVPKFNEKLQDPDFCADQQRRAATEGRIGIFKNNYRGRPRRSKGFAHRNTHVAWCVLAHNLWKLASMAIQGRRI